MMSGSPAGVCSESGLSLQPSLQHLLDVISGVPDPEIPVITLGDLGIVRRVDHNSQGWIVELTPTYSGCPATDVIRQDVINAANRAGFADVQVRLVLSPAWTTDWISAEGRRRLREYGIAPPAHNAEVHHNPRREQVIRLHHKGRPKCPRCGSAQVELLSEYGSTPCKSLYRCLACREPFDYFKPY